MCKENADAKVVSDKPHHRHPLQPRLALICLAVSYVLSDCPGYCAHLISYSALLYPLEGEFFHWGIINIHVAS